MLATRKELDTNKSHAEFRSGATVEEQGLIASELAKAKPMEKMFAEELLKLGATLTEQGKYEESKKYLDAAFFKAIKECQAGWLTGDKYNGVMANIFCHYATGCRELGDLKAATENFNKASHYAIQMFEQDANVRNYEIQRNLGICCLITEDYADAAKAFQAACDYAVTAKDNNREIPAKSYYGLALVLEGKHVAAGFNELREARKRYPETIREDSMDWASHRYHMGRAYEVTGDYKNALVEYNEAVRLRTQITEKRAQIGSRYHHSRLADPYKGLYQVMLALDQKAKAREYLNLAIYHFEKLDDKKAEVETLRRKLDELQEVTSSKLKRSSSGLFASRASIEKSPETGAHLATVPKM